MIPSPKVATYDLQPEMSAIELKIRLLKNKKITPILFVLILQIQIW